MEGPLAGKKPTLYQSMTKTLKCDTDGARVDKLKAFELLESGRNTDMIKGRSQ